MRRFYVAHISHGTSFINIIIRKKKLKCLFLFLNWFPIKFVFTCNISLVWWEYKCQTVIFTRVNQKKTKSSRKYYMSSEESAKLLALRRVFTCSRANVSCTLTRSCPNMSCVLMCWRSSVPCMLTCSSANVLVLMSLFSISLPLLLKL